MREPIEHLYFNWLCAKVLPGSGSAYHKLMVILHKTEFVWVVPADRHRASEGIYLREDFLSESGLESELAWREEPCSMLELLIGFAKRASFQTGASVKTWFWDFMENLNLIEYRQVSKKDRLVIADILDSFIWRQYDPSGRGGLFPLDSTPNDQRNVEIWYQFAEYVLEHSLI
jgi:hypothetical protein